MEELGAALIATDVGLLGDYKGAKFPRRQITVLAREAWSAAGADIGDPLLPWTVRRANLLVEAVDLPRATGGIIGIGPVALEVTGQAYPCMRMEAARPGLLQALVRDWRGGLTCRVLVGGPIHIGDLVEVLVRPHEILPRLPT
jgi:MOSC domain-containing protein YiiM